MLKLITTAALSCLVAGQAFAQSPAQQLVGGTWACSAFNDGLNVLSKQSYTSNGASKIIVMVFGETDGVSVKIVAEGVGTWSFVGDRLDETMTSMTATVADIGGEDAFDAAQDMLDTTMVNVPLSNTATFEGPALHLVDATNVVTDCLR